MFNIETYISPILLSYVDKYVRDFNPADAQLSLWEGGVTLHNLVLKADVLQKEVALPFTLVSGRIHELLIQVPWTKIISEPIVVTINTIECVLSLNPPGDESPTHKEPRTQVVEAPPGYMQALVRRIVSNIAVRVNSLIVKYVQDDIVMSLNVKQVSVDSVGSDWEPLFAEINPLCPILRRLVHLDDLTLCLDKTDADGKIRFYQEPLLYRCQLDLRVFTRLVSATKRRASSLSVHLQSSKLGFSVTNDQLVLLLRLIRERPEPDAPPQPSKPPSPSSSAQSTAENAPGTWTEWAWSWLPSLSRDGVQQTPDDPIPVPITFTAFFEHIGFVFKIMENEGVRRRPRGIFELTASDAVMRMYSCFPTSLRVQFATRYLTLMSHGKCICGHVDFFANKEEPTIYLSKVKTIHDDSSWVWKDEDIGDQSVEIPGLPPPPPPPPAASVELPESTVTAPVTDQDEVDEALEILKPSEALIIPKPPREPATNTESFWESMQPVVYLSYAHQRTPPPNVTNPYDNPPRDFEYSDWVESNLMKLVIKPMLFQISTGFMHRLSAFTACFQDIAFSVVPEPRRQILTVEECDALSENLPLRRNDIVITGMSVRFFPWDHSLTEPGVKAPLSLEIEFPDSHIQTSGPLYPHRVCSAACQMPEVSGPLIKASRVNITAAFSTVLFGIVSASDDYVRACGRGEFRIMAQYLQYPKYFKRDDALLFTFKMDITELDICGSAQRLIAAIEVPWSLYRENSVLLKESSLLKDLTEDDNTPALDLSLEHFIFRGYVTNITKTLTTSLLSVRSTIFQSMEDGSTRQAWLFSAPQAPTIKPFLRTAVQLCHAPNHKNLEYVGLWTESCAICIDPMLIDWLSYTPKVNKPAPTKKPSLKNASTSYSRRKSSSGRGGSQSGSAEVHLKPQSVDSGSEQGEAKEPDTPKKEDDKTFGYTDEELLAFYRRLNRLLITVECGLVALYVVDVSASAVGYATVKEAMDRHASVYNNVLVLSMGRLSMHSNLQMRYLWHVVKHEGPTIYLFDAVHHEESFPWKIRVGDVSCYVLYDRMSPGRITPTETRIFGTKIKEPDGSVPVTILDLVSTSITLSGVKKKIQIVTEDSKPKYKKKVDRVKEDEPEISPSVSQHTIQTGPIVSLGINLYADTPPLVVRLDEHQLEVLGVSTHCMLHLMDLLINYPPIVAHIKAQQLKNPPRVVRRPPPEEKKNGTEDTASEKKEESETLITIFDPNSPPEIPKMKTFIWLQWVIGRATIVITSNELKLVITIDDAMSSIDLQKHYSQWRLKIGGASVQHYQLNKSKEWASGVLGGRVLEVREPRDAKMENHFLAVTITTAEIANLPQHLRDELHPKVLEKGKVSIDTMWEIYAKLAPLEAVLPYKVIEHIAFWLQKLAPTRICTMNKKDKSISTETKNWPFCYLSAGGLRLVLPSDYSQRNVNPAHDDTVIILVGLVKLNPHPDNPICRRPVFGGCDANWSTMSQTLDARQYEINIHSLSIRTAKFSQLVNYEEFETEINNIPSGENPALKWSQAVASPKITPVLHSVEMNCVLAPPAYKDHVLVFGPAVEINFISDFLFEISMERVNLGQRLIMSTLHAMRGGDLSDYNFADEETCPFFDILARSDAPNEISPGPVEPLRVPRGTSRLTFSSSRSTAGDSGIYSASTSGQGSRSVDQYSGRRSVNRDTDDPMENYMELLITMGIIQFSLYATDDGSEEVKALLPPSDWASAKSSETDKIPESRNQPSTSGAAKPRASDAKSEGTATNKEDVATGGRDVKEDKPVSPTGSHAAESAAKVPLLHMTLEQPNMYLWRTKEAKSMQISLFNLWFGIGGREDDDNFYITVVTTARGDPDPITDVPPALVMLRTEIPTLDKPRALRTRQDPRGTVEWDIDRPVVFEVSSDSVIRLKRTFDFIKEQYVPLAVPKRKLPNTVKPFLYKMWDNLVDRQLEVITLRTSQIAIRGVEGVIGWECASLQLAAGTRPDTLFAKMLLTSFVGAAANDDKERHAVLQPIMIGGSFDATWDSWRRAESNSENYEPSIFIGVEFDRIVFDLRPTDFDSVERLQRACKEILKEIKSNKPVEEPYRPRYSSESLNLPPPDTKRTSSEMADNSYYKDDLRSGAFKILSGPRLPQAYEIWLHGSTVSWCYPNPRAITRVHSFPIPDHDVEVECVLESYSEALTKWEPHKYFNLPVSEVRELRINLTPSDVTFSTTWRVRALPVTRAESEPYQLDIMKFVPKPNPLGDVYLPCFDPPMCSVTSEQLSGVLRIDSYFSPRLLHTVWFGVSFAALELNVFNHLPKLTKEGKTLEGYFVSRPVMKDHRVVSLAMQDLTTHVLFGHTKKIVFETKAMCDVLDTATGTMEPVVEEFRIHGAVTLADQPRVRVYAGDVRVFLNVPLISTLKTVMEDWHLAYNKFTMDSVLEASPLHDEDETPTATVETLEGRISLWIHNSCTSVLRVGQDDSSEMLQIAAGSAIAYRWRSPTGTKKIRFARGGNSPSWSWSTGIVFVPGTYQVRLEDAEFEPEPAAVDLYVNVQEKGTRLDMYLSGRLWLANMLRINLLYKVRTSPREQTASPTISAGELEPETISTTVLCPANAELALKLKLTTEELGWSGNIPIKECRKENVPWLVKVPCNGKVPFISVWCRVTRARSDDRLVAALWPFYVIRSHLPLDAEVTITTVAAIAQDQDGQSHIDTVTNVQTAPGVGACTHLRAPGTTAVKHVLNLRYLTVENPMNGEPIPLHYGMTETSVFAKPTSTYSIVDTIRELEEWVEHSGENATTAWPYSIVSTHWAGEWLPPTGQPRSDINIRYNAVRVGGGCSLQMELCPMVLLVNAAATALTLRAHDAAPLCKLEPGMAVALSDQVLKKPFFLSMETGRDTFVSSELEICDLHPGRYGVPLMGQVVLNRPTNFAIHCNHEAALLTLYYEIKHEINILGVSTTYSLYNKLRCEIAYAAIVLPEEEDRQAPLRADQLTPLFPTDPESVYGTPLYKFSIHGRWRGGDVTELRPFLSVCLRTDDDVNEWIVPVRLGGTARRRAFSMRSKNNESIPLVVTQVYIDGRWSVCVAEDPCPQFHVFNRTQINLAIAEPLESDEKSIPRFRAKEECNGARWWCVVEACSSTHYSTPTYCNSGFSGQYKPAPSIPFLTVGKAFSKSMDPTWCPPVALAEGEQLLQLSDGYTFKVRVKPHLHSTILEFLEVDQNDISASDIRRRLQGSVQSIIDPLCNKFFDKEKPNYKSKPVEQSTAYDDPRPSTSKMHWDTNNKEQTKKDTSLDNEWDSSSLGKLSKRVRDDIQGLSDLDDNMLWVQKEHLGCIIGSIVVVVSDSRMDIPLTSLHLQRAALVVTVEKMKIRSSLSIMDVQIDNVQYQTGLYDFAVVATTGPTRDLTDEWPAFWSIFKVEFRTHSEIARVQVDMCHDRWLVGDSIITELSELGVNLGPLALYIEDAFVNAVIALYQLVRPVSNTAPEELPLIDSAGLQRPKRMRKIRIEPLDLTLSLHTSVRMYIALDQSPLRLGAFEMLNVMTSSERLAHMFTVHYLSAAIVGAGWVVGGLELLGAPGAFAARVGGASGGVRGVASATVAAAIKSMSSCAGSLARNLDLLAGDEEHARRAAAARRHPPTSLIAGLITGVTNFAINILGAVGGLAHHPLVGVAVGESLSGTTALRRGLVGAIAKPLSATADLLAYAGHGLLHQTGWDRVPQARNLAPRIAISSRWRRDCVRWSFRLSEFHLVAGFEAVVDDVRLQFLVTRRYLVVAEPESERVIEMVDMRTCRLGPYDGRIIELQILRRRSAAESEQPSPEEGEPSDHQVNAVAMARVARYTGAVGTNASDSRVLLLVPAPGTSHAFYAMLSAALHNNSDDHFPLQ